MANMEKYLLKNTQSLHLTLEENLQGRDFVVSDIHGNYEPFLRALAKVKFNGQIDRVIAVGDIIDRGSHSEKCLELFAEPWFLSVRGNHEQLLIEASVKQSDEKWSHWLVNGGQWALSLDDNQLSHWANRFEQLPLTITLPCGSQTIGICHAQYIQSDWSERYTADDQQAVDWIWGRSRLKAMNSQVIGGIDWVFSGHTLVNKLETLGNSVFIERGAFIGNPLSLIDLKRWLRKMNR